MMIKFKLQVLTIIAAVCLNYGLTAEQLYLASPLPSFKYPQIDAKKILLSLPPLQVSPLRVKARPSQSTLFFIKKNEKKEDEYIPVGVNVNDNPEPLKFFLKRVTVPRVVSEREFFNDISKDTKKTVNDFKDNSVLYASSKFDTNSIELPYVKNTPLVFGPTAADRAFGSTPTQTFGPILKQNLRFNSATSRPTSTQSFGITSPQPSRSTSAQSFGSTSPQPSRPISVKSFGIISPQPSRSTSAQYFGSTSPQPSRPTSVKSFGIISPQPSRPTSSQSFGITRPQPPNRLISNKQTYYKSQQLTFGTFSDMSKTEDLIKAKIDAIFANTDATPKLKLFDQKFQTTDRIAETTKPNPTTTTATTTTTTPKPTLITTQAETTEASTASSKLSETTIVYGVPEVLESRQTIKEEIASIKRASIKGSYSYVDSDGITRKVNYIADENGFRSNIDAKDNGSFNTDSASVTLIAQKTIDSVLSDFSSQNNVTKTT